MSGRQDNRQADYFKKQLSPEPSQCGTVVAVERILEIIIIFLVGAVAAAGLPSNREIHIILTGSL